MKFLNWCKQLLIRLPLDRLLAVIAIVAGCVAVFYEMELRREFKTQETTINEIVSSVTTRYVARFPANLRYAMEVMAGAGPDDEVLVLVDFIGYGHYSAPSKYHDYVETIKEIRKRAHIRILVFDEAAAKEDTLAQFTKGTYDEIMSQTDDAQLDSGLDTCQKLGFSADTPPTGTTTKQEQLCGKRIKRKKFLEYLSYYHGYLETHQKTAPSGYEDFLNMLILTQDHFCRQLAAEDNIEIKAMSKPITLSGSSISGSSINDVVFFWMVPGKAMVFAFPNFSGVGQGSSFKTSDERLMSIFLAQFNKKWDEGRVITNECYSTPQLFTTTSH